MEDIELRVQVAVRHFWATRLKQKATADESGGRAAVVGGKQMDGFVELIRDILLDNGVPERAVFEKHAQLQLPGYFRATKQWDLLVVLDGQLLAALEFKSQVGSFGNNYNNRTEEAIGNATDLWTAYREGAFPELPRPWIGYLMLLEEAAGSTTPVRVVEPHFKVFDEFRGASYAKRYELLAKKLVRERLYDAAAFLLSTREKGPEGSYREPEPALGFSNLAKSLVGHASAFVR